MKTIIIGAGEVGRSIAQYLVQDQHPVVVIDQDAALLAKINEELDVQTVHGCGSHPDILMAAGADKAEMLIAVSPVDEVNMVACQMAYSLFQVPKKIARVREPAYLQLTNTRVYSPSHLPVDVIISPELEVAEAMARALKVPGAFEVFEFPHTDVMLTGIGVQIKHPVPLSQWSKMLPPPLAIERHGRLIIPNEADHLEPEDDVFFLMMEKDVPAVLTALGHQAQPLENIMLLGGGNVGYNLAKQLETQVKHLRLLEFNEERAAFLAENLTRTTVLQGDALNRTLLMQENIAKMDAVMCVTSDDSVNLLATVQAKQFHVPHIYTLLHSAASLPLADNMALDKVISPRDITVSRILQHIRRGAISAVYTLANGAGEVLALTVANGAKLAGQKLQNIQLPTGSQFGMLVRPSGNIEHPNRHDTTYTMQDAMKADVTVQSGDMLIILAFPHAIKHVENLCS